MYVLLPTQKWHRYIGDVLLYNVAGGNGVESWVITMAISVLPAAVCFSFSDYFSERSLAIVALK